MQDGEGYIMRPVERGMCKYESLLDGTLSLFDIKRMNECIDVDEENRMRISELTRK